MAINDKIIGSELGTEFLIGTETPNKVTIAVDGTTITKPGGVLTAASSTLTYDNLTTTLTHTGASGTVTNIDLSSLTTDIFVNGGSFDAATSVLTLTDSDGTTPDVTVDLSTLLGVSTDPDNALSNGADGKPFLDVADLAASVSTDAGNLAELGTDGGILVTCTKIKDDCTTQCVSLFGTPLFNVFPL